MRLIDADLMVELIKAQITANEDDKSTAGMAAKRVMGRLIEFVNDLPTAQPPLEEFEWCTDCKEYDQKAHCCHRFTKVIRQTVEELKSQPQRMRGRWIRHKDWVSEGYCEYTCSVCDMGVDVMYNFCPRCGADMREGEQDE